MLRTSRLIIARQAQFPACAYYLPLCSKARRNLRKHPDIAIETCKAILEGVSKTVILGLDTTANREALDAKKFDQLVKQAAQALKANDNVIEDEFITRATSFANALGALRNARSDISHGRAVPKLEQSTDAFARLCMQMTDAITSYMLASYFEPNGSHAPNEAVDVAAEPEFETDLPYFRYSEHPDFNDLLDLENPPTGKIVYSDALYRLFYEEYVIELQAYLDALNEFDSGDENASV
jgi:hypothetical protein